jgi:hypothetical protein
MNRYPHIIIIQKVTETSSPYEEPEYETIYEGRCRCFMDKQSSMAGDGFSENYYQVVIPSPKMVAIGENFKVGVKYHSSNVAWDLVGYVKDFARYDRVCNIYFQVVKDNQIEEDQP